MRRIIGELGLRYRPSGQTDLEAHAARIALLSCDVATVPVHLLRRAVDRWVRESEFMPKASELIALAREELQKQTGLKGTADSHENAVILAHRYNARLAEQDSPLRWHIGPNNELKLAPIDEKPAYGSPLTRAELDAMPEHIVSMGLTYGFLERRNGQLVERAQ